MILFLRSTEADPDPRMQKYLDALKKKNICYKVIAWDRIGCTKDKNNYLYFHKKTKYGAGYKNIINLLLFNTYIFIKLLKLRHYYSYIHACDFDTILPALVIKILLKKKLIYDIFDWYVDSRYINSNIIRRILLCIEKYNLKHSDAVIICEEERVEQLNYLPSNLLILPNIPVFKNAEYQENIIGDIIKIAYVGVFTQYRGLEIMIEYVKRNPQKYDLTIAGVGELEDLIINTTKGCNNIHYYGKVNYDIGLKIMQEANIILAMYETKIPNHIYAAPNKYYEGLYLGRPILTTKGTLVGNKTIINNTGLAIGETMEEIAEVLDNHKLVVSKIKKMSLIAHCLWSEKYEHYVDDFMDSIYLPILK